MIEPFNFIVHYSKRINSTDNVSGIHSWARKNIAMEFVKESQRLVTSPWLSQIKGQKHAGSDFVIYDFLGLRVFTATYSVANFVLVFVLELSAEPELDRTIGLKVTRLDSVLIIAIVSYLV